MDGMRAAKIRSAATMNDLAVLRGHHSGVRSLAWTPDDERLLTTSHDGTMRVWDAQSGEALDAVEACAGSHLAILPDGSGVVYRHEGKLRFWDLGIASTVLAPNASYVYSLSYSPDGRRIAGPTHERRHQRRGNYVDHQRAPQRGLKDSLFMIWKRIAFPSESCVVAGR